MTLRFIALLLLLTLILPMLVAQKAAAPSDDTISDEVRRRLAVDADVRGAGLDVAVKNGIVTLQGRVHSDKAKKKATTLAKKVKGVTDVNNQLKLFTDK